MLTLAVVCPGLAPRGAGAFRVSFPCLSVGFGASSCAFRPVAGGGCSPPPGHCSLPSPHRCRCRPPAADCFLNGPTITCTAPGTGGFTAGQRTVSTSPSSPARRRAPRLRPRRHNGQQHQHARNNGTIAAANNGAGIKRRRTPTASSITARSASATTAPASSPATATPSSTTGRSPAADSASASPSTPATRSTNNGTITARPIRHRRSVRLDSTTRSTTTAPSSATGRAQHRSLQLSAPPATRSTTIGTLDGTLNIDGVGNVVNNYGLDHDHRRRRHRRLADFAALRSTATFNQFDRAARWRCASARSASSTPWPRCTSSSPAR